MHHFDYKGNELYCEGLRIAEIVEKTGTPLYIYSYSTFKRHFQVFDMAFKDIPHLVCYSCKANANIAILGIVRRLGGGADIVSGGELFRALKGGIPPERIVFSGVGKTEKELEEAIKAGILMINIESEGELKAISRLARRMGKRVDCSIRVNPQIDPKTHPYITTGLKRNKFGIVWDEALNLYSEMLKDGYLVPIGISSHIGSQILDVKPFRDAVRSLKGMASTLKEKGIALKYIDIGGGLGIPYRDEMPPHPEEYAKAIEEELRDEGLTLILEPGRVIVGNSGIFVTKLLYIKRQKGKTFYIVDGAMNDLIRPALYDAYHEIIPVRRGSDGKKMRVDVVGPVCESSDFFARGRYMPPLEEGELLAIMGAGAYGFSMSSNYNSRPRVAEVLVKDNESFVIRKREDYNDLIKKEAIPPFLLKEINDGGKT